MNAYEKYKFDLHIPIQMGGGDELNGFGFKQKARRANSLADLLPSLKPSMGTSLVRRKSAVERLRESRAMYVKSESVLRNEQSPLLIAHHLTTSTNSSSIASPIINSSNNQKLQPKPPIPRPRLRRFNSEHIGHNIDSTDVNDLKAASEESRAPQLIECHPRELGSIADVSARLTNDDDNESSCPSLSQAYRARLRNSSLSQSSCSLATGSSRKSYTPCKSVERFIYEKGILFAKSSPSFVIRNIELPESSDAIDTLPSHSPPPPPLPKEPPPSLIGNNRTHTHTHTLNSESLRRYSEESKEKDYPRCTGNRGTSRLLRSKSDVSPSSRIVASRRVSKGGRGVFNEKDEDMDSANRPEISSAHSDVSNPILYESQAWESLMSNNSTSRAATYSGGISSEDFESAATKEEGDTDQHEIHSHSGTDRRLGEGDQFFPSMESLDSVVVRARISHSSGASSTSSSTGSIRAIHRLKGAPLDQDEDPYKWDWNPQEKKSLSNSLHQMDLRGLKLPLPSKNGATPSPLSHKTLSKSLSCNHLSSPSIVEKNARVIKWLIGCRKALQPHAS